MNENTSVKKRIDPLSRNPGRSRPADEIWEAVFREAASGIDENTLLIVDPTDVTKKYSKKMECLVTVRDAAEETFMCFTGEDRRRP